MDFTEGPAVEVLAAVPPAESGLSAVSVLADDSCLGESGLGMAAAESLLSETLVCTGLEGWEERPLSKADLWAPFSALVWSDVDTRSSGFICPSSCLSR
jgi:hypothetical protein